MSNKLRFAYLGSPRFAELALREMVSRGFIPELVVTNPDRPSGRQGALTSPEAKVYAEAQGIRVAQPERIRDFVSELEGQKTDVCVVAAYAQIIPRAILDIPRLGTIGIHPSLLPKYRGASPIQSAILAGETETGTTIYRLDEKMDHGPIFSQERIALPDSMGYEEAEKALATLGGKLACEVLMGLAEDSLSPVVQDEATASYTAKFRTEDAFIEPALLADAMSGSPGIARAVLSKIRAFEKEPGAWTMQDGARVKLLRAELAGGKLLLRRIQKAGKNPVNL